ncbi:MAG: discoidin domain-containing protein [Kiritimatiellae bacterium]|nr:discoidin domain-containing protein [Kiritimatiellia bacterium]
MEISLSDSPFCADCTRGYADWFSAQAGGAFSAGNPEALRSALKQKLAAHNKDDLVRQASDPDMTMALAQHELLRSSTGERLKTILKAGNGPAFLKQFLGDRDWLETYLCSALLAISDDGQETDAAGRGLQILFEIWSDDPNCARHPVLRRLSAAVALAYSQPLQRGRLGGESNPVGRYKFFRDSWAAGRLHRSFDPLEAWEMRYVVGALWDDASLAWLQENIRIPLSKMGDACWAVEYRGATVFGESIHGSNFYMPWERVMHRAKNVYLNGGVCGSLSYFGTMSCAARGIPAVPCGQPGHCAYAFRPSKGNWLGGFGGPGGGCHGALYGENSAYRDMTEDALSDVQRTRASRRHAWQALRAEEDGEDHLAGIAWELSISAAPMPYEAWLGAIRWRLKQDNIDDWNPWVERLSTVFAKHPYVMFKLIEPCENKVAADTDAKLALWSRLHAKVADAWLYPTWNDMPHILNEQAGRLGKGGEGKMRIGEMILPATARSAKTFPAAIQWAQKVFPETDDGKARWLAALSQALGGGIGGGRDAQLKLYNQAILAAADADARDAFQSLSERARVIFNIERPKMTIPEPFPGENLARGGILRTSSTSGWDVPPLHASVLDMGGSFHTSDAPHPFAEVRLIKLAELSGIVIVNRGNNWRIPPLKVMLSENGDTWTEVARFTKEQEVFRVDLSRQKMRTRFVRIERDDDRKEFFHLNLIHAYGRRLE